MPALCELHIEEVVSHRNGIGGRPFYVVKFTAPESGNMIGIVPAHAESGECFVLNRDMVGEGIIAFGENSWRGDSYEHALKQAINADFAQKYPDYADDPEEIPFPKVR